MRSLSTCIWDDADCDYFYEDDGKTNTRAMLAWLLVYEYVCIILHRPISKNSLYERYETCNKEE